MPALMPLRSVQSYDKMLSRLIRYSGLPHRIRGAATKKNAEAISDAHLAEQYDLSKQVVDAVSKSLSISNLEQWYSISDSEVTEHGGPQAQEALAQNNNSVLRLVRSAYPNHPWNDWLFKHNRVPRNFYADLCNQRAFMNWYREMTNFPSLEGFYSLQTKSLRKYGGSGIYKRYDYRIIPMLSAIYPEHKWLPWKFTEGVPSGFWDDPANQREYFDWAFKELKLSTKEDWYRVTVADLTAIHGAGLMRSKFDNSVQRALAAVYPEHRWEHWKLSYRPKNVFTDPEQVRLFFEGTQVAFGVRAMDDWYRVSRTELMLKVEDKASFIGTTFDGSLYKALRYAYPEHSWNEFLFR